MRIVDFNSTWNWACAAAILVGLHAAGCDQSEGVAGFVAVSTTKAAPAQLMRPRLQGLTDEALEIIRADPSSIGQAYQACRSELIQALPDGFALLSEQQFQIIFCSMVAYSLAPYGPGRQVSLVDLLETPQLDCSNYGHLMVLLLGLLNDNPSDCQIRFVGWDGGHVGNHQQLFIESNVGAPPLLVDPTIALFAVTSFNQVASGAPCALDALACFAHREELRQFVDLVTTALLEGKYQPSDVLYYYESREHMLTDSCGPTSWPTPGAVKWRARQTSGS